MTIAAVVVTYNRKAMLLQNIESLMTQTYKDFSIFIIDNGSTDNTEEVVASYLVDRRIHYVNTGENLGGAGGFQYGMRVAFENGYDYVWLMDDDCLPHPGALDALVRADRRFVGAYGFLSSIVLWTDGHPCKMNVQSVSITQKISFEKDSIQIKETVPVQYATFVSFFVSRAVVMDVGLPIREFFIWADDLEYTRRISTKRPCYVVRESVVTHACSDNRGSNLANDDPSRFWRYRYSYRNEVFVYRREGLKGWTWLLAKYVYHSICVLLKSRSQRFQRLGIIWKGFIHGCAFHPDLEYLTLENNL